MQRSKISCCLTKNWKNRPFLNPRPIEGFPYYPSVLRFPNSLPCQISSSLLRAKALILSHAPFLLQCGKEATQDFYRNPESSFKLCTQLVGDFAFALGELLDKDRLNSQ